jgi:hypothetical protein
MADEKNDDGMRMPVPTVVAAPKVIHVTIDSPMSRKELIARHISNDGFPTSNGRIDRNIKTASLEKLSTKLFELSVLAEHNGRELSCDFATEFASPMDPAPASAAKESSPARHDFGAKTPGAAPSDSSNDTTSSLQVSLGRLMKSSSDRLPPVPETCDMPADPLQVLAAARPAINGVIEGIKSLHNVLTRPDTVNHICTVSDTKVLVHQVCARDVLFDFGGSGRRLLGRFKGNDEMLSRICNFIIEHATVERLSVRPIGTRAHFEFLFTGI